MPKGSCLKLFAMGAAFAAFMPLSEVAIATPNQAGMNAGGAWARDFNPSNAFRSATSSLGLEDTKTSGELGGEVGLQVKQKQQRNFRCRDGARLTAGGIRVFIEECEQSDSGELDRISVSVCDALTQGIRCSEDRYTVTREIPLGGEAAFSGGNLYGAYRVEAECSSSSCTMTMHQLHGDAWGGNDMRQQGNDRVNQDPNHPSNTISDVRDNPTFERGSNFADDRSKCLGNQINQLFSEGDIPVSCDPNDPRTIDFLDINAGGECKPDKITTDSCVVDIPTRLVTCEPESRECEVRRDSEEFSCARKLEVTGIKIPTCKNGDHLLTITSDPCPSCVDYLRYNFYCQDQGYRVVYDTVKKSDGSRYTGPHSNVVSGGLNTTVPKTTVIEDFSGSKCFRVAYEQNCNGTTCNVTAYFENPCKNISYAGSNSFPIPMRIEFTDRVIDECTGLESRRPEL